jgi:hypothetical protein
MQTTALTLLVIGLVLFVFNLQTMLSLHAFSLHVKRKRYKLASHVYFLGLLNTEVVSALRERSEAEIYEAPEEPPYSIILSQRDENGRTVQ